MPHWCKISRSYLVPVPNYWTWTKTTLQKKWFFWSNPHKIEVVITSLIDVLKLPNLGHMTTSKIQFESREKILLVMSWTEIMMSKPLFQNIFILRKPSRVAIFADIVKIVNMFIKKIFKDSKKVERFRNYRSKCNLYLYFLIYQNLVISSEKMQMSAELNGCIPWFIYFLDLLLVRYKCAKFHHCSIRVTDFREEDLSAPIWIELKPSWTGSRHEVYPSMYNMCIL